MPSDTINPVNHDFISGAATTAAEAGKSGLGGLWKGSLIALGLTVAIPTVVIASVALLFGGIGALGLGLGAGLLTGVTAAVFGGMGIAGFGATLGAVFGLAKGSVRGLDKVSQERGASEMLNAQIELARAQNGAATINIPQANNYQVTPEEWAQAEARMRQSGQNQAGGHADRIAAQKNSAQAKATAGEEQGMNDAPLQRA